MGMQPRQAAGVINQGTNCLFVVGFHVRCRPRGSCIPGGLPVRVMSLVPDARDKA